MNGYIQIQIGEKPVGLKFGFLAIKLFTEASIIKEDTYFSKSVNDKGEKISMLTIFGIAKLMQSAYRNNCEIKEIDPEIDYETFYNFVEEANTTPEGQEVLSNVLKTYTGSTYSKKLVEAMDKAEEKKSQGEETNP